MQAGRQAEKDSFILVATAATVSLRNHRGFLKVGLFSALLPLPPQLPSLLLPWVKALLPVLLPLLQQQAPPPPLGLRLGLHHHRLRHRAAASACDASRWNSCTPACSLGVVQCVPSCAWSLPRAAFSHGGHTSPKLPIGPSHPPALPRCAGYPNPPRRT